jgi:hypothetical protein
LTFNVKDELLAKKKVLYFRNMVHVTPSIVDLSAGNMIFTINETRIYVSSYGRVAYSGTYFI